MAKTVTPLSAGGGTNPNPGAVPGNRVRKRFNIAGDASYPTGGYAVAPSDVGLMYQIDYLDIVNEAITIWTAFWNRATQKMQFYVMSSGAEVGNGVDVHTMSADVVVEGY